MASSTASRRYAKAVFELALERGELDAWTGWLQRIAAVAADKEAGPLLANLKVSFDLKKQLLEDNLRDASKLALNLAYLMVQRKCISIAPDVAADYLALLNAHRGVAPALVRVAGPIAEDQRQAIAARLAALTGKKIEMKLEVDPALIGGMVARVGDQLYDASLRRRFELLKKALA